MFSAAIIFKAIDQLTAPVKQMQTSVNTFAGAASKSFANAGANMNSWSQKTISALEKTEKKASTTKSVFNGIIGASLLQSGISGIIQFGKEGLKLASDLTEVQNVVDTTFKDNSKIVDQWASKASVSFGIGTLAAKRYTGTLGAMLKSSGISSQKIVEMSTNMTGLAGDLASFYNLPVDEAFEKIRAGISGETMPLKQLGINMSEANLKAFAMSQGIMKSYEKMTEAEKVQIRYNYLMKVTKDQQGDFAKTLSTSAANQERVLDMQKKAFSANLMKAIIPSQIDVLLKLNSAMSFFNKHAEEMATVIKMVIGVLGIMALRYLAIKSAIIILTAYQAVYSAALAASYIITGTATEALLANSMALKIVTGWEKIAAAAQWLFNTSLLGCPIIWIIVGIMAIVAAIILLVKHWKDIVKWVTESNNIFAVFIRAVAAPFILAFKAIGIAIDWVGEKFSMLWQWFKNTSAIKFMISAFKTAFDVIKSIFMWYYNTISSIVGFIWKIAKFIIKPFTDLVKGAASFTQKIFKGDNSNAESTEKPVNKDVSVAIMKKTIENKSSQDVQININDDTGRARLGGKVQPIPVTINSTRKF